MTDLHGAPVFLSASFPSGERGARFTPYDPSGIADAVSAFSRAILGSNGTLAFGGHPTITPLVLMISRELRVKKSVTVFQSRWFEEMRLPEVDEIEKEELGVVRWTRKVDGREDALRIMRTTMIQSMQYAGALFVGGMEGILDEYAMIKKRWPDTPCMPVAGPGGAAAKLDGDYEALGLAEFRWSRTYPFMALRFVDALAGPRNPDSGAKRSLIG